MSTAKRGTFYVWDRRADRAGTAGDPGAVCSLLRDAANFIPPWAGPAGHVYQRAGSAHPCAAGGGGYRERPAAHADGLAGGELHLGL